MKKALSVLAFIKSKLLYPASLYTVLLSIFFMMLTISDIEPSITMGIYLSIFGFALEIAASKLVLNSKKIIAVLRYIIHYVINLVSFIVFWHVCYPQSIGAQSDEYNLFTGKFIWEINSRQFVFGLCLFTVIYIVLVGISAAAKAMGTSEKQAEEEYESIF